MTLIGYLHSRLVGACFDGYLLPGRLDADYVGNTAGNSHGMCAAREFAGEKLNVLVGVNTGPLIAGNVGGGGRQTYSVHGDAMNMAACLEAVNKQLAIRVPISGITASQLGRGNLVQVGDVEVRGLSRQTSGVQVV